ncbi:mitochondrial carrier [Gloeophyllum trabeum ATCC 11539]|uniref:Mitochondrial carrier n=1 Tax=Gloeophyllum trabeum (strain ATCC 11539 / FP-39264 / Madison 617) TaxID=670483 RepID=S7RLQ3_GLOTA|nr:mitochondrial carrier [Gloeophyllum trabeum ATCC 11539]EPQ55335.1 mitochondrial carrier [Gloeophyllum trabeum ATCC 11539]
MTSTLPPLVQAFSGAAGSATANAITYPLDLVTTRVQTSPSAKGVSGAFQVLQHILHRHGVDRLYDGIGTDTGATILSNFFYFYAYLFLRNLLSRRKAPGIILSSTASSSSALSKKIIILSVPEELAVGFLAGVLSRAISTPLGVITARLQTESEDQEESEPKESIGQPNITSGRVVDVVKAIYSESGLAGFWRGFETVVLLSLNPSLTFFLYQFYRRLFLRGTDRQTPKPAQAFFGAAFSNSIAVTILYPLILAKTRLQTSRLTSSSLSSASYIWSSAYKRDGLRGLYQGLEVTILKGFLSQGVTMMVKQRIEQLVIALYLYRRLRS